MTDSLAASGVESILELDNACITRREHFPKVLENLLLLDFRPFVQIGKEPLDDDSRRSFAYCNRSGLILQGEDVP